MNNTHEEELRYIEIHEDVEINGIKIKMNETLPVLVEKGKDFKGGKQVDKSQIISGMLYELKKNRKCEKSDFYKKVILADKTILTRLHDASVVKAQSELSEDARLNIDILTSILVLSELEESYINLSRGIINAIHIEMDDEGREDIIEQYEELLLNILLEGLEKYPTSYSLLFHLSDYYKNNENYEFAYKYLDKLKEHHSGKEIEKLENEIKRLEKHENDILYIYDLINTDRADDALKKCDEFLQNEPNNWYCLMLQGWAYRLKGKWKEACESALKSISNGGDDFAENYNEIALSKFALGDIEEARYYQEIAFDMEDDSIEYATNLAMINLELKDYDKAFNTLFSACMIDEDDAVLKSLIAKYEKETNEKFVYPKDITIKDNKAFLKDDVKVEKEHHCCEEHHHNCNHEHHEHKYSEKDKCNNKDNNYHSSCHNNKCNCHHHKDT